MDLPPKSQFVRGKWVPCLVLFFLVAGVFSLTLPNGFVLLDDPAYVTSNPAIQAGLTPASLRYALTANVAGNWHPLTLVSHLLDCQVFGLHAWGHHLTSLCLHALNTVLVFLLLQRLTGAVWRSFFVALFFGLHPMHVESAAWIAERKDVLSTAFALLTLLVYARYTSDTAANRRRHYWLALGLFACGLMCKSMLVTLPCLMLLLDFWPLNRWSRVAAPRLILEKIPFFVLSLGAGLVAIATQQDSIVSLSAAPLLVRIELSGIAYVEYLGKLFYPAGLNAYYPQPAAPLTVAFLLSVALLLLITVAVVLARRRYPYLLLGWFWFVISLVPVIGLLKVGDQFIADRYTYLPSLGLFTALIWFVTELTASFPRQKTLLPAAGLALAALCAVLTARQIQYWHDSETLLRRALAVTRNNWMAHLLLGTELHHQGRLQEAIPEFQAALAVAAYDPALHRELASDLESVGRPKDAIQQYIEVWKLLPGSADAGNDLAMALSRQKMYAQAAQVLQVTVQSHPDIEEIHLNLGNALARSGKLPDAVAQYRLALALKPGDLDAHNNLGAMLYQLHQLDDATLEFQTVLKLDPQNAVATRNLETIMRLKNPKP